MGFLVVFLKVQELMSAGSQESSERHFLCTLVSEKLEWMMEQGSSANVLCGVSGHWKVRSKSGKQQPTQGSYISEVYIIIIVIQNVAQKHLGSVRQVNLDFRSGQNLDCICSKTPSPAHRVFCLHQRPNSIWLLVWDPLWGWILEGTEVHACT